MTGGIGATRIGAAPSSAPTRRTLLGPDALAHRPGHHRVRPAPPPPQATTVSYEGGTSASGLFHGRGRALYASGVVCDGQWRGGVLHGEAEVAFPDGITYRGDVRGNSLEGTGVSGGGARPPGSCCCRLLLQACRYPLPRVTERRHPGAK
jgi:hypothetical protein